MPNAAKLLACCLVVAASAVVPALAGDGTGPRHDRIVNQVLDLLDGELTLRPGDSQQPWISRTFETSAFTRIGLKAAVAETSSQVVCGVAWGFSAEDRFIGGPPVIVVDPGEPGATWPGRRRPVASPDDVADLYLATPIGPELGLGETRGLLARVVCRPVPRINFGLDCSPDEQECPELDPVPATLTDVKVLLRAY